jgi:hypothetical protein
MRETRASFSFPFYYCTCSSFKQNLAHKIGNKFNSFVVDKMEFQKPNNFFVVGSDKNSIFAQSPFISNVLAL